MFFLIINHLYNKYLFNAHHIISNVSSARKRTRTKRDKIFSFNYVLVGKNNETEINKRLKIHNMSGNGKCFKENKQKSGDRA